MCSTAICPLCQRKSWTGCGSHVSEVMSNTNRELWCTCRHAVEDGDPRFPPRAGTGSARKSVSSESSGPKDY
ncbi:hypothetical protein KL930_000830 [Ogataea haglerorum]|uniref:Uncharacterized protein n=1 Tax=Ogataea haglerorum TaxID=1937702 RepID=A0AAN6DB87_9ASCO|nr:uncharacterized protein KL911_003513 [Ogataea haglerorum]KAG7700143.1 hypothetical protein KL915_000832 [Ogataea haglerorum]KAG7701800.1 hypothetical protein KL951_000256 [Ogataea haglerorum]KAG7711614.1 hypothetical protein KL914_000256 [Ogataea haglerorum]KAG7712385.1 hypothetical protein KL950_000256 [Ogataea haglerorum]KAG7722437.1 hypothetical protein KL913_000257 [Ogataea haglerorum]